MERIVISFSPTSHLQDHILLDRAVVPATTLLLEIGSRLSTLLSCKRVGLSDVFFLEPLVLNFVSDEAHPLFALIVDARARSLRLVGSDEDATVILVAKYFLPPASYDNAMLHPHQRSKDPAMCLGHDEFYAKFASFGYGHKGAFQTVESVTFRESESIVEVNAPPGMADAAADGVMQAFVLKKLLATHKDENELSVPFAIKEVILTPDVHVPEKAVGSFNETDFWLFSTSTEPLIHGKGLVFKKIHRPMPAFVPKLPSPVFVRATACRLPGGVRSLADLAELVMSARTTDTKIPAQRVPERNAHAATTTNKPLEGGNFLADDVAAFDAAFFGISALEAKAMDPQHRLLLEVTYECFQHAGVTDYTDCGFFVGQMGSEYCELPAAEPPNALGLIGGSNSVLAGRLNFFFDSQGPSEAIDTACSSSLVALKNAVDAIRLGRCERAIVAGSSIILSSAGLIARSTGNLLSVDGTCRSFDIDADGYGRADGIVAVLIDGRQNDGPFLARIDAIEVNHGGRAAALTAPSSSAQCRLVTKAVRSSGQRKIDYWECHGTGTALGDPIEVSSLQKALGRLNIDKIVLIGSLKANIGHCEGAAGLAGLMKAIVVANECYAPPLPRFKLLNRNISIDDGILGIPIIGEDIPSDGDEITIGVSSFGVSGTNAAVVATIPLSESRKKPKLTLSNHLSQLGIEVLPFSANTQNSLDALSEAFENIAATASRIDFQLLSAAAALTRPSFRLRSVFIKTASGDIAQISMAQAQEFAFCVDFTQPVSWKLYYRNSGLREFFLHKIHLMTNNGERVTDEVIRIADVRAKWQWLHAIGVKCTQIAVSTEAEAIVAADLASAFIFAKVVDIYELPPGCLAVNSKAYPLVEPWHLNRVLASVYLCSTDIDWNFIYGIPDELRNYLPTWMLPTYCFDRRRHWNKVLANDFDNAFIGNVVDSTKDSGWVLENLILKRRLEVLFIQTDIDTLKVALAVEIASAIGRLVGNGGSFKLTEVLFTQLPEVALLDDNTWIKTVVFIENSQINVRIVTTDSRRAKEIQFATFTATLKEVQPRSSMNLDLFQEFFLDFNFLLIASPLLTESQCFQIEYNERESSIDLPESTTEKLTTFKVPVLRGGSAKIHFIKEVEIEALKEAELCERMSATARQAITDVLKGTVLDAIGGDIDLSNEDFVTRGFMDLGMDSLSMMGFMTELNQRHFPIAKLTTTDLFTYTNIRDLANVIAERIDANQRTDVVSSPPPSPETSPYRPSASNAWDVVSLTHQAPSSNDISLRYNENQASAEAHCSEFSFDVGIGDSFDVFVNKLSKLMLSEVRMVFLFNPGRLIEPTDESLLSGTVQFLLSMATALGKLRTPLRITVIQNDNPVSGFFAGFWKSFAVEKQNCEFEFIERIRPTKTLLPLLENANEPRGTWVITGGTAGIGLVMARHIAEFPLVEKVYAISRRGIIDSMHTESRKLIPIAADVSYYDEFFDAIKFIRGKIDGIVHSAGTVADSIIERQNLESFEKVIAPKVIGMNNVLRAMEELGHRPRFVILNSSVSSVFGNFGQTNYAAANCAAEKLLAQYRAHTGVGSIVHWGNWNDVGMASDARLKSLLHSYGFIGLSPSEGVAGLDFVIGTKVDRIVIAKLDRNKLIKARRDLADTITLGESNTDGNLKATLIRRATIETTMPTPSAPVTSEPPPETPISEGITEIVHDEIRKITKQPSTVPVSPDMGFMEAGLDSITMYAFSQGLTQRLSKEHPSIGQINVINLFEHPTPRKLISFLESKLPHDEPPKIQKTPRLQHVIPLNTRRTSLLKTVAITKPVLYTTLDSTTINAHVIKDEVILPAAFEIDAMLRSGSYSNLKNIILQRKTESSEFNELKLLNSGGNFELQNAKNDVISNAEAGFKSKELKLPKIFPFNKNVISISRIVFYKSLEFRGVAYGKELALLSNIETDGDIVITGIQIDEKCDSLPPWVLIESGMQALIAAAERRNSDGSVLLPARILTINVSSDYMKLNLIDHELCKTVEIYGVVNADNERFVEGDVWICSGNKPLIEMLDVIAVKQEPLNRRRPSPVMASSPELLQSDCQSLESSSTAVSTEDMVETTQMNKMSKKPASISVLGYACQLPGPAEDVSAFWDYLNNTSTPSKGPFLLSADPAFFDPANFGITPKEAPFIDPQQRLLMKCAKDALQTAGILVTTIPKPTGIFIGTSSSDFAYLCATEVANMSENVKGYLASGTNSSCMAGRLAHWLKTSGPAVTIDTGCSSFAVALSLAAAALSRGDIDYAVVGSANLILTDNTSHVLKAAKMLSPSGGCATFSEEADGYARSEGVVVAVLGCDTVNGIRLAGWAVNHNGGGAALTVPNSEAQITVMKAALAKAEISPNDVDVVECHGTGTSLGDPIEVASVLKVFADNDDKLILTATKAHIGHAEAAASGIAFVAACEMLKNCYIPPQPQICKINTNIQAMPNFEKVIFPQFGIEKQLQTVLVNSFGFSGTNCSFVLTKTEPINVTTAPNKLVLINGALDTKSFIKKVKTLNVPSVCLLDTQVGSFNSVRTTIMMHPLEQKPIIVSQKVPSSSNFTANTVLAGIFSYPTMFLAELTRNQPVIADIASNLQRECTNFEIESGNVFLNAVLISYFERINLKIMLIVYPLEFNTNNRRQLQQLVTQAGVTDIQYSSELPAKPKMPVFALGSLFEGPENNEIYRPSEALNDFLAQVWRDGANLTVPRITLPIERDKDSADNLNRYWCLEHPSRPPSWYKSDLLRRGLFKLTDVTVPLSTDEKIKRMPADVALVAFDGESVKFAMKIGEELSIRVAQTVHPDAVSIFAVDQVIDSAESAFKLCKMINDAPTKCVVISRGDDSGCTALLKSVTAEKNADHAVSHIALRDMIHLKGIVKFVLHHPGFYKAVSGKLMSTNTTTIPAPKRKPCPTFNKVLITGGTGGIALAIASAIPAAEIILTSRSAKPIETNLPRNAKLLKLDVTDSRAVRRFFNAHHGIDCIIHCAGAIDNGLSAQLSLNQFEKVASPKIDGTRNLLQYCESDALKKFIAMSSIASIQGSFGQANYAWANGVMKNLVAESKLPESVKKLVIAWGPWDDIGMLAGAEKELIRAQIEASGLKFVKPTDAVNAFMQLLPYSGTFVLREVEVEATPTKKVKQDTKVEESSQLTVRRSPTIDNISQLIAHVSGIQKVDPNIGLMTLGLDSLMIEDFRVHAEDAFGVKISLPDIYGNPTVEKLAELISKMAPVNCVPIVSTDTDQVSKSDDIAIIAYSGTVSGCETVADFWDAIFTETSLSTPTGFHLTEDACRFDHKMFNMPPQLAGELDIQTKLALKHSYICLQNAGYLNVSKADVKIACFGAAEPIASKSTISNSKTNDLLTSMYAKNAHSFLPVWVSHLLDLRGPSATVYSACSSTLAAIQVGIQTLQSTDVSACLIVAASVPPPAANFSETSGIAVASENCCRPFDKHADGLVPGAAVGAILLKRATAAAKDGDVMHAVIKGVQMSNDGFAKANFMAPGMEGQLSAMQVAQRFGLVDYVECHATGTAVGDKLELAAMEAAYNHQTDKIAIGSVKANVGHCFAAAGMTSIFKVLGIFERAELPRQMNLVDVIDEVKESTKFTIVKKRQKLKHGHVVRAAIHAFGIGGTDGCLVIESDIRKPLDPSWKPSSAEIAFFFAPQGIQYANMLTPIDLAAMPSAKLVYDHLINAASHTFSLDFAEVMASADLIEEPEYAQVALFIVLVTISHALTAAGIHASVALGHSLGEYAALCFSGAIPPADTIRLLAIRSKMMASTAPAKMLSFKLKPTKSIQIPKTVEISAYLSRTVKVAVGSPPAMDAFADYLTSEKIEFRWLRTSRGFHSSMMNPVVPKFQKEAAKFDNHFASTRIPVISNRDGAVFDEGKMTSMSSYLGNHLRDPVRIDKSLDTLLAEFPKVKVIVDIGPPGMLANLLLQRGRKDIRVIRTLPTKGEAEKLHPRKTPVIFKVIDELKILNVITSADQIDVGRLMENLRNTTLHTQSSSLTPKIAVFWSDALGTVEADSVSPSTDFFALGGNSLSAVQLCWRIEEELNLSVPVTVLIDNPTFGSFCTAISKIDAPSTTLVAPIVLLPFKENAEYPLSPAQEQMFMLYHLERGTEYNIVFSIRLQPLPGKDFQPNVATRTINELIKRQASLRSVFFRNPDGIACQKVLPMDKVPGLTFTKVNSDGFKKAVETEKNRKFDLAKQAFFIKGFHLSNNEVAIIASQHHIITDGWSMTIFAKEFSELYSTFASEPGELTPTNALQYCQLSSRLESLSNNVDIPKFAETLAQFEASELPTSYNHEDHGHAAVSRIIDLKLLLKRASMYSTTPSMIALTAFAQTLAIWTEHQQIDCLLFGVASSGRIVPEARNLIGYFLNNLIFAIFKKSNLFTCISDAIALIKAALTQAQRYEAVPYHRIVAEVRKHSHRSNTADLFKIYFNYRHSLDFPTVEIPGVAAKVIQETSNRVFDLAVTLDEVGDEKLQITADYNKQIYNDDIIHGFLNDFVKQIETFTDDMNGNLCRLSSPSGAECLENNKFFRDTVATVTANIAEAYSHRIALMRPDGVTVTYAKLVETAQIRADAIKIMFANKIGRNLSEDDIIPLIMDFNSHPEWFLAVMFAGTCYAPIDSSYLIGYIEELIKTIGAEFCIVSEDCVFRSADSVTTTAIDATASKSQLRWNPSTNSHARMYVLFTSGSTGTPKAVQITHHNVLTFLKSATRQLFVSPLSVIAHSVNTVFDVSVFNIFAAWTTGATLRQFPSIRKTATDLDVGVSHLFLTSAVFNTLGESSLERLARHQTLEYLIVGGETPDSMSLEKILQFRRNSLPKLVQIYGPTEATVWVTTEEIKNSDGSIIGTPNANVEIFLTAVSSIVMIPKSSGAVGEICIAGDQLASAYFGKKGDGFKTLQIHGKHIKVFATGDLARWMPDGSLKFIGRGNDGFVKRNGMRIDLKMIENGIKRNFLTVIDSCVLLVDSKLVGFVTTVTATDLRPWKEVPALNLPLDFTPEVLLELKELPVTKAGKRDNRQLAELAKKWIKESSVPSRTTNSTFKTEKSIKLASIWSNILKIPSLNNITMESDFFAFGGTSIDLFQLQQQIESEFDHRLDIDKLHKLPKFSNQLALLTSKKPPPKTQQHAHVVEIRRSTSPIASVYCLHAIGGTVYPFYTLDAVIQEGYNIYGVPFDISYPAESLYGLATFYADTISSHAARLPLALVGHSLGGSLAHIIAHILLERNEIADFENTVNVVMFDAWCLGIGELNLSLVKEYLESQFKHIGNAAKFVSQSMRLASFMQSHEFEFDPRISVNLFKASILTASPLRRAIMPTLTPAIARSFIDNGWTQYSASVTTILTPGDHDGLLKAENLAAIRTTLQKVILKSTFMLQ
uniref:Fatty acid synthase n=1 Tax=Panagrellus redivivus TaxID=6233 RepID=A0A7E4VTI0_PANRE